MNDKFDINWYAMDELRILKQIGEYVKYHRMEKNKTQTMLAKDANISRFTLSLLERGETVMLATLIQVLRALSKLNIINEFLTPIQKSPLLTAELERKVKRQRVSTKKKKDADTPEDDFVWL